MTSYSYPASQNYGGSYFTTPGHQAAQTSAQHQPRSYDFYDGYGTPIRSEQALLNDILIQIKRLNSHFETFLQRQDRCTQSTFKEPVRVSQHDRSSSHYRNTAHCRSDRDDRNDRADKAGNTSYERYSRSNRSSRTSSNDEYNMRDLNISDNHSTQSKSVDVDLQRDHDRRDSSHESSHESRTDSSNESNTHSASRRRKRPANAEEGSDCTEAKKEKHGNKHGKSKSLKNRHKTTDLKQPKGSHAGEEILKNSFSFSDSEEEVNLI